MCVVGFALLIRFSSQRLALWLIFTFPFLENIDLPAPQGTMDLEAVFVVDCFL